MPDPQLKTAMEEIKAVLRKYDIAGIVFLGSQSHSEFLLGINPSWSCAKFEAENELRIRAKREDFPSLEAQKKCLTDTVGMLAGFRDLAENAQENLGNVLAMLGKHIEISHRSTLERDEGGER